MSDKPLAALQRVYAAAYPLLPDSAAALIGARFAVAFLALIVPTTLMGSTLPLMLKASASQARGTGADVGLLYRQQRARRHPGDDRRWPLSHTGSRYPTDVPHCGVVERGYRRVRHRPLQARSERRRISGAAGCGGTGRFAEAAGPSDIGATPSAP